MKRLLAYLFIVLGLGLVFSGFAFADLTFVSWGGAYTASQQKAYIDTWSKGSRVTVENYNGGLDKIRAQVNSGNVKWDVVDILPDQAIAGCDEGLFEKIPQLQECMKSKFSLTDDSTWKIVTRKKRLSKSAFLQE